MREDERRFPRRALFSAAIGAAATLATAVRPPGALAARGGPLLSDLTVGNGAAPFAGDHPGLTTLAPSGPGGRAEAAVQFGLPRQARVTLEVVARRGAGEQPATAQTLYRTSRRFGRGRHQITWRPDSSLAAGTYVLRVTAGDRPEQRVVYSEGTPSRRPRARAPVVRVLGIEAAFAQRSYQAGDHAVLVVAADTARFTVDILRSGPEQEPTYANNEIKGIPVTEPLTLEWRDNADGAMPVFLDVAPWPSGVYCARIRSDDGRAGFAPIVIRPAAPRARVAVVMPTNTWQAYNFYDLDGDGFGDSWYVSQAIRRVDLTRPHLNRGVPYRFRSYDLSFLRWLAQTGKDVDYYSEDDLETFAGGDALRAAYDLVVFPGHTEYVTAHAYDIVSRYRDLGGNLLFLSANNFFRRVERQGETLELVGLWRDLGRPEAALCGVQYRANDRGTRQAPYTVTGAEHAPWLYEGTGLVNGSRFGLYGIEIDSTTPASPPGTQVLARIPDLLGPGLSAEMSYYETTAGARIFSAGVLNFGGQILLWPETRQLLENLWARLTPPH